MDPRRALLTALLLSAACARELNVPTRSAPRVDTVAIVGLEGKAVATGLPVMGGEPVALLGEGFPSAIDQLQVTVSGTAAEVLASEPERAVIRFPVLGSRGSADLTVSTSAGFRTVAKAFRYDGPGQPQGLGQADLQTAIAVGGVVPVAPVGTSGFSDLAVAFGSGDSALLVYPTAGIAAATIPLGLVPFSATARARLETPASPTASNVLVEVLAIDEKARVGFGRVTISQAGQVLSRLDRGSFPGAIAPKECTGPRVLFTQAGTPVGAWVKKANGNPAIATIDIGADGTQYQPLGGSSFVRELPADVAGWAAWKGDLVVLAAGNELYLYDAAARTAPVPLTAAAVPVSQRLVQGCAYDKVDAIHTVAVATSTAGVASEALAVSYRAGGLERVALVDLVTGAVRRGVTGVAASALALAPVTPYVTATWRVLAASGGDLVRFSQAPGAPACGEDLVPDASLQLSENAFSPLPTFAGMATFSAGTRVLTVTQAGDLLTVLPPTLSSPGAVFRFASYGRVSMSVAGVNVGGVSAQIPVAVAEHTWLGGALNAVDTGSAQLVLALDAGERPLALGGSAFGRGAVWVRNPDAANDTLWDGALAHTGDLPDDGTSALGAKLSGGSSAVTSFKMDTCDATPSMQVRASAPLAGNPDLVTQGPARAGAFGLDGVARYGPATAPTYLVSGTILEAVTGVDAAGSCLSPVGTLDATGCTGATVDLGVTPLDITLSAGDATAAARSLDTTACRPCTAPFACAGTACAAGDILCQRATCDPRPRLDLVRTSTSAKATVALPAPPVGVAPDRGGGFLVTVPCTATTTCFAAAPWDTLCAGKADLGAAGALLWIPEGDGTPACLAVGAGLAGAVAVTPNGAEAWVSGPSGAGGAKLLLTRLALPRRLDTGRIDDRKRARPLSGEVLGNATPAPGGFASSGVTFAPDGSAALLTVPADFRILLLE